MDEQARSSRREATHPPTNLPQIPLFNVGAAGTLALIDHASDQLDLLMGECLRHYGRTTLAMGDRISRRWLDWSRNPYRNEIAAVAARVRHPGAVMLNMSYEWACTCGVGPDPEGTGNRMLRTLDWPAPGLGRSVVVALQTGSAGPYYAVTWPGFVGLLTAIAPGRFAAAINQPPMRRRSGVMPIDWMFDRVGLWQQRALPPSHLLRHVFDTCATYAEAEAALRDTPICLPAFYTLSGAVAGDGCAIERLERTAAVHPGPTGISNHWLTLRNKDHDRERGSDSRARLQAMEDICHHSFNDFSWVVPPILNPTTRLSVTANAATGNFAVQGWEKDGPATAIFHLETPDSSRSSPQPVADH